MKKLEPPTKQEMIDYAKEKNLLVDADYLWEHWNSGEWINIRGRAVLPRWKQHMWTHHRIALTKDVAHKCHRCRRKPGVYPDGRDRDGHVYYACHDCRPIPKPMPEQVRKMAKGTLKTPDYKVININDARNKNRKTLGL